MEPKDFRTLPLDELYPIAEGARHLLIGCRAVDYAASRIANAIEDCNAKLLNLNIMRDDDSVYELLVALRVNCVNVEAVARSLERYGYTVIDFDCADDEDFRTLRDRVDELLRYINI